MSKSFYRTESCKSIDSMFENKENACSSQNAKCIEGKSDVEKKKGLYANAGSRRSDVDRTMSTQKFAIGKKTQFQVYRDDNDANKRSRSLVRTGAYRREIRKVKDKIQKSPICTKELEKEKPTSSIINISQRARSLSNQSRIFSNGDNKLSVKLPRRTCSENRKSSYTPITLYPPGSLISSKIKLLSNDVKKRTLYSIEMWKNKMRKSRIDIMAKISPTSLNTQTSARLRTQYKDRQFKEKLNFNCTIPPSDSPIRPLTAAKVCYEQSKTTNQFTTKKQNFEHIDQTLNDNDYLIELPDTEREREEKSPKLSIFFLRESINAQQRKVIVEYLIHLGVHCNYDSSIIYQTVKLFDVAIDRILVNTEQIQLMALACFWIILKREFADHKVPTATKILKLAEDVYKDQEAYLLICEKKILSALKFNVRFADPYSLLMYYISNLHRATRYINRYDIMRIYFCGSYLIDVSMFDESLCIISVFVLAITAFELSLDFVLTSNSNTDQTWRQSLRNRNTLAIWEERQMSFIKQIMVKLVLESGNLKLNPDSKVVYKKYRRSRRCGISDFLLENAKKITEGYV